ncbi:MAG: hypothetical protein GXP53_09775 [Deltaproteobacteria bacterium]|nr:hypothetical protein [Deltaproteobacteria bacterium]
MTPMYYYMWEFFTSITIIILVIAYIVHDQLQQRKEKQGTLQADTEAHGDKTKKPRDQNPGSGLV